MATTDLDYLAAALASLAAAVIRRDPAAAVEEIGHLGEGGCDHDIAAALADYLTLTGLIPPVSEASGVGG